MQWERVLFLILPGIYVFLIFGRIPASESYFWNTVDEKGLRVPLILYWVRNINVYYISLQHGRQLFDSYRSLVDDLAQEDLDLLAHARSCSVSSIAGGGTGQPAGTPCSHSGSEPEQDQLQLNAAVTPTYNHSFHSTVDGLPGGSVPCSVSYFCVLVRPIHIVMKCTC
jgi:hypothetical protein